MKPIFESAETCGAYGAIDYCYWRIKQIRAEMNKPTPAINQMIDAATGFAQDQDKKWLEEIVSLLESVIENKKTIEADYSGDEQMLTATRGYLAKV